MIYTGKKGLSGAHIDIHEGYVRKTGDRRVFDQALYMAHLGADVCPRILRVHCDLSYDESMPSVYYYEMERLYEPDPKDSDLMVRVKNRLKFDVWSKDYTARNPLWIGALRNWLQQPVEWERVIEALERLYAGVGKTWTYCRIHGDPTLANALISKDGALVLADPIEPRDHIPPLREVDLGKMLQSAIGWETRIAGWPSRSYVADVLEGEDELTSKRAWFWCYVHLLRILPYAKDESIKEWVHSKAEEIYYSALRF